MHTEFPHEPVIKPLKDLTLLDRFLFAQAMEDPVINQIILQIILDHDIHLLDKSQTEKEFRTSPLARSIRVDVYSMDDADTIYDTEVQKKDTGNLPKRSRFYQALMDFSLLAPGTSDFNRMKDCCLIMISPFDLWNHGSYRYTFRYRCDEYGDLLLGDGAVRIFLNTHGTDSRGVSRELVELLHYLEHSTGNSSYPAESPRIQELQRRVEQIRASEEMGVKYMQLWEERLMDRMEAKAQGKAEGRSEGRSEGSELKLISLIQKKCRKGLSAEDISDLLEEDLEILQNYYDIIQKHPEYSAEEIFESLKNSESNPL